MTKKKKKTHEQQQQQQSRNVMLSKKTKTNGSVRCQANRRLALPDTDTNTLNKCFNLSSLKCSNVFCIYMYIMVSCLFFSSRLKVRKLETYFNSIRISLTLSFSLPFRFHFVCFFCTQDEKNASSQFHIETGQYFAELTNLFRNRLVIENELEFKLSARSLPLSLLFLFNPAPVPHKKKQDEITKKNEESAVESAFN